MRPKTAAGLGFLLSALLGCAADPAPEPAPPPEPESFALDDVTQLLPLDAVDDLPLDNELAPKIAAARTRVPARVSRDQRTALEELEARSERAEAAAREADDVDALGVALATYYWERLRLFDASLEPAVPVELGHLLGAAAYRGD